MIDMSTSEIANIVRYCRKQSGLSQQAQALLAGQVKRLSLISKKAKKLCSLTLLNSVQHSEY